MGFSYLALNGETYFKKVTFWKNSFCHSFFEQDLYESKIISDFEVITNLFNTFFASHCTTLLMIVYTLSNPLSDFTAINYL